MDKLIGSSLFVQFAGTVQGQCMYVALAFPYYDAHTEV